MTHSMYFLMIATLLLLSSCDNSLNNSETTNDPAEDVTQAAPVDLTNLTLDEQFAEIARNIEGFGGLFLDENGQLQVYLKDPSNQIERAMNLLPSRYGEFLGNEVSGKTFSMNTLKGDYDFVELLDWKRKALDVLGSNEVVSLDIDETQNRLVIGVVPEAIEGKRPSVIEFLRERQIPREAVDIVAMESPFPKVGYPKETFASPSMWMADNNIAAPFGPLATNMSSQLTDRVRPMKGGLKIHWGSGSGPCTLGFHAERTSTNKYGFVTNSHCSAVRGSVNGALYYQSQISGNQKVAFESVDPPHWTSGGCGGGAKNQAQVCPCGEVCRQSDAMFAQYISTISWGSDIQFGKIHKTNNPFGSKTINGEFNINAEPSSHLSGTELHKVGQTTGWTKGNITGTCLELSPVGTNITYLCQYRTSISSDLGDSGSPIFKWSGSGSNVTLYGILWGGPNTSTSDYSPISSVKYELGPLRVK